MSSATMDHRKLGRRGRDYYSRFLRDKLEPQHKGKFLALDVETGDYELGDTTLDALDRAEAQHPDRVFCILRVGYPTAGRIGAEPRGSRLLPCLSFPTPPGHCVRSLRWER